MADFDARSDAQPVPAAGEAVGNLDTPSILCDLDRLERNIADWQALMDRIHGRLPDGSLIEGVEVFRQLYAAVGFRRLVAMTRLPGVDQLLTLAYQAFARNRLRLTGRCVNGACTVHARDLSREAPA